MVKQSSDTQTNYFLLKIHTKQSANINQKINLLFPTYLIT